MKVGIKVLILTVDPGPLSSAGVFLYKHEALSLSVEIVPNLRSSRPVLVIEPVDSGLLGKQILLLLIRPPVSAKWSLLLYCTP